MARDASGNYSLPIGYLAVTGETIQASQHNPPLEDIAAALTGSVPRSGAAPMSGPLKATDGTALLPAVTFNSDPTTGFFKTAAGVGVSVGGVKVAEFTSGGLSKGARFIGELIPYTGTTAPALTVLPYGQTLSRAAYPDFWIFAQAEIAAGNTSYNNGDGSTTFGILDMRGRVAAGRDTMGGTSADRLNPTITSGILGSTGGAQTNTLTAAQIPAHPHDVFLKDPGHGHGIPARATTAGDSGGITVLGSDLNVASTTNNVTNLTIWSGVGGTGTQNKTSSVGGGGAHNNVQPTMICNYLLFVGA